MFRLVQLFLMTLTLSFLLLGRFGIYQCLLTDNYCLTKDCCEEVIENSCPESNCYCPEESTNEVKSNVDTENCCYLVPNSLILVEALKKANFANGDFLVELDNLTNFKWKSVQNVRLNSFVNLSFSSPHPLPFYKLYCSYLC